MNEEIAKVVDYMDRQKDRLYEAEAEVKRLILLNTEANRKIDEAKASVSSYLHDAWEGKDGPGFDPHSILQSYAVINAILDYEKT